MKTARKLAAEAKNAARRSLQLEEIGIVLSNPKRMGQHFVQACETSTDTALRDYYVAVQRYCTDEKEISLAYWRLGNSLGKSLAELWLLVNIQPCDLLFEAMQREIDEAFDFFAYGWESGVFTNEAYERLCDLSNVAQERLEEALVAA